MIDHPTPYPPDPDPASRNSAEWQARRWNAIALEQVLGWNFEIRPSEAGNVHQLWVTPPGKTSYAHSSDLPGAYDHYENLVTTSAGFYTNLEEVAMLERVLDQHHLGHEYIKALQRLISPEGPRVGDLARMTLAPARTRLLGVLTTVGIPPVALTGQMNRPVFLAWRERDAYPYRLR